MAATKKKATKGKATARKAKTVNAKVSAKKATSRKSAAKKVVPPTAARGKTAPRKKATRRAATASEAAPRTTATLHPAGRRAAARRARPAAEPPSLQPSLVELTRLLRDRMASRVPSDYVRGKTRLRDEVMELLSCSSARAEHIVDSLVARGYARFGRHPRFTTDPRFGIWHLDDTP
jgi:hypothetical protein